MADPCKEWQDLARSWKRAEDGAEKWRQIVIKFTQCNPGVLKELQMYPDREHAENRAGELIRHANVQGVDVPGENFAQEVKETADQLTALAEKWEKPVAKKPKRNVDRKADPVTMWNGELVYEVEDLHVRGAGIDFVFRRTYRHQAGYEGPLGWKWDHSFNAWLRVTDHHAVLSLGDLSTRDYLRHPRFGDPGFDYWLPPDGEDAVLLEVGETFVVRRPNGARLTFERDPSGETFQYRLSRVEDRHGNALRLVHGDHGVARVEVNHPGRFVLFAYDDLGRLTSLTDHTGRRWAYGYDDLGDLVLVEAPTGDVVAYEYNSAFAPASRQHSLLRVTDPAGRTYLDVAYGEDAGLPEHDRVVRQRQGGGEVLFSYADLAGEAFENDDSAYGPDGVDVAVRATTLVSRAGHEQVHFYNASGNLLSMEEQALVGGRVRRFRWEYRYNADGALTGSRTPEGVTSQYLYGRDHFLRRYGLTDATSPEALDRLTMSERQAFGRLLATVKRARPPLFALFRDILDTEPDDIIEKRTYEPAFGQILTCSDPRFTRHADPQGPENPEYDATLCRYVYTGATAVLSGIQRPAAENPDGTPSDLVRERFLAYDARGRLLRHEDEAGLVTETRYFGPGDGVREGFVNEIIRDPGGLAETIRYQLDELGRPTTIVRPRGVEANDGRFQTRLVYDALDRIVSETGSAPYAYQRRRAFDGAGLLVREERDAVDAEGTPLVGGPFVATFRYDEDLLLVEESAGGARKEDRAVTKHRYDAFGARTITFHPAGNRTRYRYDHRSLPVAQTHGYGSPEASRRTTEYDGDRRVVRTRDGRGNATTVTYDGFGRVVATEGPLGYSLRHTFSKTGKVLVERALERRGPDLFLVARGERRYDALDRLIVEVVNRFETPLPVVDIETDFVTGPGPGEAIVTHLFYDAKGRALRTVEVTRGVESRRAYDRLGRRVTEIDPAGNRIEYRYDLHGNPIRTDRHQGGRAFSSEARFDELDRAIVQTDGLGARTTFAYDSLGHRTRKVDALGNVKEAAYDLQGRLVEERLRRTATGLGSGAPLPPTITRYEYDPNGNLIGVVDPLGHRTTYEIDALDRRAARIDAAGARTEFAHDPDGNVTRIGFPSGRELRQTIDAEGRILRVDAAGAASGPTFAAYAYDFLGKTVLEENDNLRVVIRRNSFGQPVEETWSVLLPEAGLGAALVLRRGFDTAGRLVELVYPGGRRIRYDRDALGGVTAVTNVQTGAGYPGRPGGVDPRPLVTQASYLGRRRASVTFANGAQTSIRYDGAGRVIEIRHAGPGGALLTLDTLADGAGNIRFENELEGAVRRGLVAHYDSLGQLVRAERRSDLPVLGLDVDVAPFGPPAAPLPSPLPDRQSLIDQVIGPMVLVPGDEDFIYDLDGNRLLERTETGLVTYVPDEVDAYTEVGGVPCAHDPDGRLSAFGPRQFGYDAWGRLVLVTEPGHEPIRFFHDARGRRIAKAEGTAVSALVHDDDRFLAEYRGGALALQVVPDDGVDHPLALATAGEDFIYHADLRGSIRLLTDHAGALVASYRYTPFGVPESDPAVPDNPLRYAARPFDRAIGSYDFRARQYDPRLGRFLQRDPVETLATQAYAYVGNNPLAYRDPGGTTRQEVVKGDPPPKPADKAPADTPPAPPAQATTPPEPPAAPPQKPPAVIMHGVLSEDAKAALQEQVRIYNNQIVSLECHERNLATDLAGIKTKLFEETRWTWPTLGTAATLVHWGKKASFCLVFGELICAAEVGAGVVGWIDEDTGRVANYGVATVHGWAGIAVEAITDATATGLHHLHETVEKRRATRADKLRGEIESIEAGRAAVDAQIDALVKLRTDAAVRLSLDENTIWIAYPTDDGGFAL